MIRVPSRIVVTLVLLVSATLATRAFQARGSSQTTAGRLTIDSLIDIKHPSAPVWSPDSRRVAFLWDRAGVIDLFVVGADGARPPVRITNDGVAPTGVAWSADSTTLLFTRGDVEREAEARLTLLPR